MYKLNIVSELSDEVLDELESEVNIIEEIFGDETKFSVFAEAEEIEEVSSYLAGFGIVYSVSIVEENIDWSQEWRKYLKNGYLTPTMKYSFDDETYETNDTIFIVPAMAFGTGDHATTKNAGTLLEKVAVGHSVLDVGCGSGILAICAEKLGADTVDAIDIDSEALKNARLNIERNNCKKITLSTQPISDLNKSYDVVVANIILSVLNELKFDIELHAKKYIVYSGILEAELEDAKSKLINDKFMLNEVIKNNGWCGLLLERSI